MGPERLYKQNPGQPIRDYFRARRLFHLSDASACIVV
jgi:hypothetical protein